MASFSGGISSSPETLAVKRFFSNGAGYSASVEDITSKSFRPTHTPEYIYIVVPGDAENPAAKLIATSDKMPYQMWYGLENRFLYPKATAAKIALAHGIVKFFGGKIKWNDAIGKSSTFPTPRYIGAENGKPWYQLQDAILALKPLTQSDVDAMNQWASY